MTKSKKTHENQPPELLAPVSVTQTESEKAKELTIDVPPGHVYIVDCNEVNAVLIREKTILFWVAIVFVAYTLIRWIFKAWRINLL